MDGRQTPVFPSFLLVVSPKLSTKSSGKTVVEWQALSPPQGTEAGGRGWNIPRASQRTWSRPASPASCSVGRLTAQPTLAPLRPQPPHRTDHEPLGRSPWSFFFWERPVLLVRDHEKKAPFRFLSLSSSPSSSFRDRPDFDFPLNCRQRESAIKTA